MAYLNANIPIIECYVRGNYLRNQKDSHDKYFEVGIFGFSSIPNRVPMFHFLMEDGGLWWRAPITAFCTKPGVKELPLDEVVMWDCFSYNVSVTTFYEIAGCTMQYTSRRKVKRKGKYLFTNILTNDHINIIIDLYDNNKKILMSSQSGKFIDFKVSKLLKYNLLNPLFGFKIMSAILFEATMIFFKGGKYYARKKKLKDTISFEGSF